MKFSRLIGILFLALVLIAPPRVRAETLFTHTVAWGETITSIARAYDLLPQEIARVNRFDSNRWLWVGQTLTIPTRAGDQNDSLILTPSGYHIVRAGESLDSIATRNGIDVGALAFANELPPNGIVYAGWSLKIPGASATYASAQFGATSTYIVQRGDTLAALALRFSTTIQSLAIANNIPNLWLIYAGQRLKIPRFNAARANTVALVSASNEIRLANIPLYRQQQTLTCEEAAAAMATRGKISEAQLLAVMPRDDNPMRGIRGRTNSPDFGSLMDYGVYAPALLKGLSALGIKSEILFDSSYDDFKNAILAHLRAGRAIIWWQTWQDSYQLPVLIKTNDGAMVRVVPYEHTSVIVGANDRGVIVHDPYDASARLIAWNDFRRESEYFDNMALVIFN
ncbi:MAG: LysM peptidoglycan-binding domain-containing protein [Chloroflexi bacterium]|nr:LysM peptidoglycan-binding domain-containing protein [Chloroflexota bacterium]